MYAQKDSKDATKSRLPNPFSQSAFPIDLKVMFTSLFGKRDSEPEPKDSESQSAQEPAAEEPKRRGLFDRMREAVTRTRQSLSDSISGVIALTREIDETSLDELEGALCLAARGASTAD